MRLLLTVGVAGVLTATVAAQSPPSAPAAQAPAAQAEKQPEEPFTYHADGRRDPFVSPLTMGPEPVPEARKGDGLSSLTLAEITVRGVIQSRSVMVAIIAGPDTKTYIVHEGDRLLDGFIKGITRDGLVVVQRMTDPLAKVKERETHKLLQSLEAAKE